MTTKSDTKVKGITKRQFMEQWKRKRESAIRKMYEGDPHGAACVVASLMEVEDEGERLWRKHGKALRALGTTSMLE